MPPSHPTFEVIAFHAPLVESGRVRLVIHTDTGLRQLVGPVEIFRAAVSALDVAITEAPAQIRTPCEFDQPRRARAGVSAEKYQAAFADFKSGAVATKAAAALKHGVSAGGFYVWLSNHGHTNGRA